MHESCVVAPCSSRGILWGNAASTVLNSKSLWMLAKILLRLFGANRRGMAANAVNKSWTSVKGSGTNAIATAANSVKGAEAAKLKNMIYYDLFCYFLFWMIQSFLNSICVSSIGISTRRGLTDHCTTLFIEFVNLCQFHWDLHQQIFDPLHHFLNRICVSSIGISTRRGLTDFWSTAQLS